MFRFLLVLLLSVKCDARCTYEGTYVECDSTKDVSVAQNQQDWTRLLVRSFGGEQTIEADFLKHIPNVTRLDFENVFIKIEANAFVDGTTSLKYLRFFKCDLPVVKARWFSATSVRELDIYYSKLTTLEERCFNGLDRLDLIGNNITQINANIFNGTSIWGLALDNNQIRVIETNALANISKLYYLSFNQNFLTSFNSKQIVGTITPGLIDLTLSHNQIKYLDEDSFAMFPNIEQISLDSNDLEHIGDGTFNELNKLFYLGLSLNKLKTISNRAFSYDGLPSLRTLDLEVNRLSYLPKYFTRNFPKLDLISIFKNPWQCACYREILHNLLVYHKNVRIRYYNIFLNGEGPVCIVPETNSEKCIESTEDNDDLSQMFVERLKDYL